jgi:hypothetical protein
VHHLIAGAQHEQAGAVALAVPLGELRARLGPVDHEDAPGADLRRDPPAALDERQPEELLARMRRVGEDDGVELHGTGH